MKYVYPVVFEQADEGGYIAKVPDIKGCITEGDDVSEAIYMVEDAMEMMLAEMEDENAEIPKASEISEIDVEKYRFYSGSKMFVSLVPADTKKWRMEMNSKTVKKNLTLPEWLNVKAEKAHINFSQVLQEALCQKLGVVI